LTEMQLTSEGDRYVSVSFWPAGRTLPIAMGLSVVGNIDEIGLRIFA
jgi:hypothetical protein